MFKYVDNTNRWQRRNNIYVYKTLNICIDVGNARRRVVTIFTRKQVHSFRWHVV